MSSTTSTRQASAEAVTNTTHQHNDASVVEMFASKKYVVIEEEHFNYHLSNTFFNAWRNNLFENYLYGVYGLVAFLTATVTECGYPHATLVPTPQALFHAPIDPSGRVRDGSHEDVTGADDHTDGDREEHDVTVQSVTDGPSRRTREASGSIDAGNIYKNDMASAITPSDERCGASSSHHVESQSHKAISESPNIKGNPTAHTPLDAKEQRKIPDFARIIVFNRAPGLPSAHVPPGEKDLIVDFWEVKRLHIVHLWNHHSSEKMAETMIEDHIEQVYDTAMEAFKHNPTWTRVTALLLIGCYFTQLEWTRELPPQAQESDAGSRPRPPVTPRPASGNAGPALDPQAMNPLIMTDDSLKSSISSGNTADLRAAIARLHDESLKRMQPSVYFYNELAFDIKESEIYGARCSLSPRFIEALALPLRAAQDASGLQFTLQPSWLDCHAPKRVKNESKTTLVAYLLRQKHLETLNILDKWLAGENIPELDAKLRIPPTPQTDPTDVTYVGRGYPTAERETTPTPNAGKRDHPKRLRNPATARGETPQEDKGRAKLEKDRKRRMGYD